MELDIGLSPFSRRGSYLAVVARPVGVRPDLERPCTSPEGFEAVLRSLRGLRPGDDVFHLSTEGSLPTESSLFTASRATPECLALSRGAVSVEVSFADPATVRLRARAAPLVLTRATPPGAETVIALSDNSVEVALESGWKFRVTAVTGRLEVDAPWDGVGSVRHVRLTARPDEGSEWVDVAVEEYQGHRPPPQDHAPFATTVEEVRADFREWLAASLLAPEDYTEARELCAYTCWSSLVAPSGLHRRPTMYMSKNWMHGVWSWDHCFNAMALATTQPDLAWHQYMTVFDHIHPSGLLPDNLTDTTCGWSFCKPPVHGWTLRWLMRHSDVVTSARLAEIYPRLAAWTDWWFTDRDDNDDGIPQYNHGNESGWDNSSAFAAGVPLDSPDLSAYLVVQMDTLAEAADLLGHASQARQWTARADELAAGMLDYFTEGHALVSRQTQTGAPIRHNSLLSVLPLVAGSRLPQPVREHLLDMLREGGPYLTPHGLATEPPTSAEYEADGYWRGPIWAPTTFLLTEAMRDLGEHELADTVSRRFCDMVADAGPAENFDALDGRGLRDPAFSWTASTFMLLAARLSP